MRNFVFNGWTKFPELESKRAAFHFPPRSRPPIRKDGSFIKTVDLDPDSLSGVAANQHSIKSLFIAKADLDGIGRTAERNDVMLLLIIFRLLFMKVVGG